MRYKLLIFDFDGTLADSLPWFTSVINDVAAHYRLRQLQPEDSERLRSLDAREFLAELGVPRWKVPFIARYMRALKASALDRIGLFAGVETMLERLRANDVGIAIVSSDSERNIRRVLGPHAGLVQHYACSASLFGKGPKIRKVLRRAGIRPDQALYIGDEIRDLDAARASGTAFGAVTWGYALPDALVARSPDLLFDAVEDIGRAA